jgi:UDP-glucose 4-epimerase
MKALVTGGAGFIGSQLVDHLLETGYQVICIDNLILGKEEFLSDAKLNKNFVFLNFDLLNLEKLKEVFAEHTFDIVFHLAANSDIGEGTKSTDRDLKLTFLITYNVLECMRIYKVSKLFFTSSPAIFGNHDLPLSEDLPMKPESLYGASKLASENFIRAFSNLYGIQSWIIRLSNMVGKRATHGILYDFKNKVKEDSNQLIVLGDGQQCKPYMHVSELIECIFFLLKKSNKKLNIFNVGPKDGIKVSLIAELFLEEHGKGHEISYTGGKVGWKGDQPFYSHNSQKLYDLGWKPSMSSRQAVERSIKELND